MDLLRPHSFTTSLLSLFPRKLQAKVWETSKSQQGWPQR